MQAGTKLLSVKHSLGQENLLMFQKQRAHEFSSVLFQKHVMQDQFVNNCIDNGRQVRSFQVQQQNTWNTQPALTFSILHKVWKLGYYGNSKLVLWAQSTTKEYIRAENNLQTKQTSNYLLVIHPTSHYTTSLLF